MPENPIEKLKNIPPEQWTMINVAVMLTEIYTDVKHLKKRMGKKANKWVEGALGLFFLGSASWAIKQVLDLIPAVKAFMN